MLVSIVMAAFNAQAHVTAAIESVVAQTYADWELVVVDDGSTDATLSLVTELADDRVRVLACPHVGVLAQVRNRGIDDARGELIALLDADDAWLEEKLARQVGLLRDRPRVGLVHTAGAPLVDGVRQQSSQVPRGPTFRSLLENNFVFSSSVLIRRALLEEHGAFDPDPVLDGSPDYDLWLRLAPRTEFAFVDDVLTLYRVHAAQMSVDQRAMSLGAIAALERARIRDPELVRRDRASFLVGVGRQRYLAGAPGIAARDLTASLLLRPLNINAWQWLLRAVLRLMRIR